jgi:hypothetical protein
LAEKRLRCYAHGRDNAREAICVDLDIAVHGRSLPEVQQLLGQAIETYVEDARKEDPKTAARLLGRRAPFPVRAKYGLSFLAHPLKSQRSKGDYQSPCRYV